MTTRDVIPWPRPPLENDSVALRPFVAADRALALELESSETTPWGDALPDSTPEALVQSFDEARRSGLLHLVIADPSTDAYLGEVTLTVVQDGVIEVGCALLPNARGRGLATEALRLVTDWGFTKLGVARAHVVVAVTNEPAIRLSERAGFVREGVLRDYLEEEGRRVDAVIMSRLPGDEGAHAFEIA